MVVTGGVSRLARVRASEGATWGDLRVLLPAADWLAAAPGGGGPAERLDEGHPIGRPPLVDGAVVTTRPPARSTPTSRAPVDVVVTQGPDIGAVHPLPLGGSITVGRDPASDLCLADPAVSRHQLLLRASRRGVLVEPERATNGARLDADPLTAQQVWRPGRRLRVGGSTLELVTPRAVRGTLEPDRSGGLLLAPRAQTRPAVEPVAISTPPAPDPGEKPSVSLLAWLVPLVVSAGLAVLLRMPYLVLFGLMAPAMAFGSHLGERRSFRRRQERALARHADQVRHAHERAAAAAQAEVALRRARCPDLARLLHRPPSEQWDLNGAALICRLGTATTDLTVELDGVAQQHDDVPVELAVDGTVALVGDGEPVRALARAILLQLACRHPPDGLAIALLAEPGAAGWNWLGWLPHVWPGSATTGAARVLQVVDALGPDGSPVSAGSAGPGPSAVSAGSGGSAGSKGASVDPGSRRGPVLLLCREPPDDPAAVVVLVPSASGVAIRSGSAETGGAGGSGQMRCRPDLVSEARAEQAAHAMAPWRAAPTGAAAHLPRRVGLGDLTGEVSAAAVAARWRSRPASTSFVLGADGAGLVVLDLVRDGPHALVGGTTGAGKSELLRTVITSLALVNRPDELVFVLVDYKGGAAFAEAALLPHTVGLITDLDPSEADRALTSLTAELKRRERLLAAAGAKDIEDYRRAPGTDRLARLVVVIDEFRALAEELPAFLEGLVRLAALGRSLGVHLVLATQRPAGVVSADVRANVNLRIALRMRDASDSHDVVECADAAALPEGVPGRALIRTGASPVRAVQVAQVEAAARAGPPQVTLHWIDSPADSAEPVERVEPVRPVTSAPTSAAPPGSAGTLASWSRAITEAAAAVGATPPPSPWLPPLPGLVRLTDLSAPERSTAPDPLAATLGLVDRPQLLEQGPLTWSPLHDGHLALVGAPRSGRSTTIRTLIGSLLGTATPADLHLYAFDSADALTPLDDAPHTAARVGAAELARGSRVLDRLTELVSERQQALAASGHGSVIEQRAAAALAGAPGWPALLLIIDGWPAFHEAYAEHDRGRGLDTFVQLLRDGPAVGLVAMLAGDRTLLSGRVGALVPTVWCSRMTDPTDLMVAGLSRQQVPTAMPPGRVVRTRDGALAQVAVLGDGSGAGQLAALRALCTARAADGACGPDPIVALPRSVAWSALTGGPREGGLVIGVGGDAGRPVVLPLDPSGGGLVAVIGPARSGRSTTLRTIARAAAEAGLQVVEASDPDLAARLASSPRSRTVLLVDDAGLLADSPAEDAVLGWAAGCASSGGLVAGVLETEAAGTAYRGLAPLLTRGRTGILLQPSRPADGQSLGVATLTGDLPLPGRGVLVDRGRQTRVQVAQP